MFLLFLQTAMAKCYYYWIIQCLTCSWCLSCKMCIMWIDASFRGHVSRGFFLSRHRPSCNWWVFCLIVRKYEKYHLSINCIQSRLVIFLSSLLHITMLSPKLSNLICHSLEVVFRCRDTQCHAYESEILIFLFWGILYFSKRRHTAPAKRNIYSPN